jgi:hypothetical protein
MSDQTLDDLPILNELGELLAQAYTRHENDHGVWRRPFAAFRPRFASLAIATAVATAAAVVAVVVATSGSGPGMVGAREVRMVLRGAAARLAVTPGAVLHSVYTITQGNSHKISSRSHNELWEQTTPPYNKRYIYSQDGHVSETATVDGRTQLFDPRRNEIYAGEGPPPYTVRRLSDGGYRLTTRWYQARPATITAAQLRALRAKRDTFFASGHTLEVVPFSALQQRPPFNLRSAALTILHSAHATVRRTRFDGHAAIEVSGRGPGQLPNTRNDYYVAPRTYTPLGLVIQMRGGAFLRERYTTYELLPGGPRTVRRLVTLTGAHPHAHVNTSTTAWNTASKHLLP